MKARKPEGWAWVMRDEGGGLAKFTDEVLKGVEKLRESDWQRIFDAQKRTTNNFELTQLSAPRMTRSHAEQAFPGLKAFKVQYKRSRHANLQDELQTNAAPQMRRFLIGASALLEGAFVDVMADMPYEKGKFEKTSLDMSSPQIVTTDNVQTMLDVATLLSRFVRTPTELIELTRKMLQVCPNDKVTVAEDIHEINPDGYTYLELFAQAPFGFWAESIRNRQPETYRKSKVVRSDDSERPIDPLFVHLVTREPLPAGEINRKSRHGGCPALFPKYHPLDLINRLGRLYIKAQQEFLILDSKAT